MAVGGSAGPTAERRPDTDGPTVADRFRLLRSKLRPARSHVPLVCRDALLSSLSRSTADLILVSAPAGAGKSTLLGQFAEADGRPVAWLQLDDGDNDPIVLLAYLAHAIDGVHAVDPDLFRLLQMATPPVDELILPVLEDALLKAPPFLFVLDDAHLVANEESWRLITFLADRMAERRQLLLGSRIDPPLPLARLHAAGRVTEYRMVDLAMSRDEAARLLELHGFDGDGELLDELLRRTEGWVTGLCLAVLAGEGRPPGEVVATISGDRREIAAYLTGEVLEHQSARVQRFLLRTSVLDSLSRCATAHSTHRPRPSGPSAWPAT